MTTSSYVPTHIRRLSPSSGRSSLARNTRAPRSPASSSRAWTHSSLMRSASPGVAGRALSTGLTAGLELRHPAEDRLASPGRGLVGPDLLELVSRQARQALHDLRCREGVVPGDGEVVAGGLWRL